MQPKQSGLPTLPTGVLHALVFACAGAAAAGGYVLMQGPLASWRNDLTRRSELIRTKLDEAPALRSEHGRLTEELEDLLARVETVSRRIPNSPQEGEFLSDLSRIAASHGVTIDDFRRGQAIDTPTHSVVTVTATARGPFAGLCGWVEDVARLPRLTEALNLDATPDQKGADHAFRLSYALYYAIDSTSPPETDGGSL